MGPSGGPGVLEFLSITGGKGTDPRAVFFFNGESIPWNF